MMKGRMQNHFLRVISPHVSDYPPGGSGGSVLSALMDDPVPPLPVPH